MVNDEQILLVMCSSLERPVEGASHQESIIHNHKLVVHVIRGLAVCPHGYSMVSKCLAVIAFVRHAFIISNDSDLHPVVVPIFNCICKNIVCEVEDADAKGFPGHLDILFQFVHIALVGEEEGIEIAWLRLVQVFFNLAETFPQVFQDFLIGRIFHLGARNLEKDIDCLLDGLPIASIMRRHLDQYPRECLQVYLTRVHFRTVSELTLNFVMRSLKVLALCRLLLS